MEYLLIGKGSETIVCFHGFGRKAEDFEVFQPILKPDQQLLAINLFAHEGSIFPVDRIANKPLKPAEWQVLLEALLKQESIHSFHLLGYSMGGRIAMKTWELMPDRVLSVLLIAPDGIKINALYRFASGTSLGRWLYRQLIHNPKPLFRLADQLHRWGLMNDKLHRFVYVHLDSEPKRQQVYDAWLIYKKIFPQLPLIAQMARNSEDRFHLIIGKYDSVITPAVGDKLCRLIGNRRSYFEIESGHQLLNARTVAFIDKNHLWP